MIEFIQQCIYEYNLNPLNIEKILESRKYSTCLWLELDRIFSVKCNGNCLLDNQIYFKYNISIQMNIIFNFYDNEHYLINSTLICDKYFGTINNTKNTLDDIDFIIDLLLLLYAKNSINITDIIYSPKTSLISNMPYLECKYDIKNIIQIITRFTIKSTNSKQKQINKIFDVNGLFYNQTIILLNQYFDGTIIVYPTINITNSNTIPTYIYIVSVFIRY